MESSDAPPWLLLLTEGLTEFPHALQGDAASCRRLQNVQERCSRLPDASLARDIFREAEGLLSDMDLFQCASNEAMARMAWGLVLAAQHLLAFWRAGRREGAVSALERVRSEIAELRNLHVDATARLLAEKDAVALMKDREMFQGLRRMTEGLSRAVPPLEELIYGRPVGA